MKNQILLDHGNGGKLTHTLINDVFIRYLSNPILNKQTDAAIVQIKPENIAFTSDSYVVKPIFFPGGDIGKLSICGTVNDLAVSGAEPLYISCGFIIEEGFLISDLEKIVKSMGETADKCNVKVVTGDTKVVEKGGCDGVFINTSGIGVVKEKNKNINFGDNVKKGDKIIINGYIADHGISILSKRNSLDFKFNVESDCAGLNHMIFKLMNLPYDIKFMRDATRGGLATVLCELVNNKDFGLVINESAIPIREEVRGVCELLGFDPLYIANEGKAVFVVAEQDADSVLNELQKDELGKQSKIIGEITEERKGMVVLKTAIGGSRVVEMLAGGQLPRIC